MEFFELFFILLIVVIIYYLLLVAGNKIAEQEKYLTLITNSLNSLNSTLLTTLKKVNETVKFKEINRNDNQLIGNDNQLIGNDNQIIGNDNQFIGNNNQLIGNDNQPIPLSYIPLSFILPSKVMILPDNKPYNYNKIILIKNEHTQLIKISENEKLKVKFNGIDGYLTHYYINKQDFENMKCSKYEFEFKLEKNDTLFSNAHDNYYHYVTDWQKLNITTMAKPIPNSIIELRLDSQAKLWIGNNKSSLLLRPGDVLEFQV
jgi:hypothetical protein